METLIDTAMSYLQYEPEQPWFNALYNTAISNFFGTKHALEHKGKAKNKIIPQAFYQASAFIAKSKGHVNPPASERAFTQVIGHFAANFRQVGCLLPWPDPCCCSNGDSVSTSSLGTLPHCNPSSLMRELL
ncbi:hypothetical protein JOB18_036765 [Solea senegalensis]|uniref:Uncharacterized protein n=1 Tax=Solea senegalensis TaxID=28829 RepID=A0AAV6RCS2_SOLSE|nr:hypothetical protein JOB18_036765 [Solea senegalensis]